MTPEPLLLSRKEACHRLGVSERKLDYLISGGDLPAVKLGRRTCVPASGATGVR